MTIAHPGPLVAQRHAYGSDPEQFGDLRLPHGAGPHPVIVYVHGGGWQAAVTLAGAAGICTALTEQGYATWSVEYRRLGNGGGWPATFDDVLAAASYLQTLAGAAPIDLSRAFVGGQSAGGQLALWLASRSASAQSNLPTFRGAIGLAPASDLRTASGGKAASPMATLLGGTADQVPERYASSSPIELAPIGVPQLIVHGTSDTIVPYAMSQAYVQAAQMVGDRVEFVTIEGADHLDLWNPASSAFDQVVSAATAFLSARTA
jgi:acetyl esterase/lipase